MSVPYVAAALGGVVTGAPASCRIALRAQLLADAFVGVAVALATGSVSWGRRAASRGALVGALHGFDVVFLRVDAVVGRLALSLLAAAGAPRAPPRPTARANCRRSTRGRQGSSASTPSCSDSVLVAAVGVGLAATPRGSGSAPPAGARSRAMGLGVGRIRSARASSAGPSPATAARRSGSGSGSSGRHERRPRLRRSRRSCSRWAQGARRVCLTFAGLEGANRPQGRRTFPQLLSALPCAATSRCWRSRRPGAGPWGRANDARARGRRRKRGAGLPRAGRGRVVRRPSRRRPRRGPSRNAPVGSAPRARRRAQALRGVARGAEQGLLR